MLINIYVANTWHTAHAISQTGEAGMKDWMNLRATSWRDLIVESAESGDSLDKCLKLHTL